MKPEETTTTNPEYRRARSRPLLLAVLVLAWACLPAGVSAATITVDSLFDSNPIAVDNNCTLREAIVSANTNASDDCTVGDAAPTVDTIEFSVEGTITLALELPPTSEPVTIDGYTAPTAAANTDAAATNANLTVVIDAGGAANGLPVDSAATIRGLVIQNYSQNGIELRSGGGSSVIAGSFVGTSADGLSGSGATASEDFGIRVRAGADNVTIGGTAPADRNLVSDNGVTGIGLFSDGNTVQGNLIGTDATGLAALPNSVDTANNRPAIRIQGSSNNTIGGSTAAERNVISGNNGDAMQVLAGSSNNVVEGNYVGVDITGNGALPQVRSGILLFTGPTASAPSDNNQIIGNVVAAMPEKGIVADGPVFTNTLIDGNFVGVGADGATALGIGLGEPTDPEPGIAVAGDADATVSNNLILNNAIGLQIEDPTSSLLANSTGNCIVFNNVGVENTTDDSTVDVFENNWWGQPDGPSGNAPGSGDSLTGSGTTDVDPFLTSAPAGCPSYEADLQISKSDSVDPVVAGSQMTYTITVDNAGPQGAINVQVNDTLPAEMTFVSSNGCSGDPNGFPACALGDIPAGGNASYTLTVDVDPTASGTVNNSATVSTDTVDPNGANDSVDETTDIVPPSSDLVLTITNDAMPPADPGEQFNVTLTLTNNGPQDNTNVLVSGTLTGLLFVSSTCATSSGGDFTWNIGAISASQTLNCTMVVEVGPTSGGTASITASASGDVNDPSPANNTDITSVVGTAALVIPTLSGWSLIFLSLLMLLMVLHQRGLWHN